MKQANRDLYTILLSQLSQAMFVGRVYRRTVAFLPIYRHILMDVLYPMEGYTINYMCGVPGNWAIYKLSKYAGSDWENEKYTSTSEIVLIV